MTPDVTDDYGENVRLSPEYFERAISRPVDPGPLDDTTGRTLVTGSGSSFNMALLLSNLLRRRGHRARTVYPYELTRHERLGDHTVVCISQSGETTDIVDAVSRAEDAGCRPVGITTVLDSSLGTRVDHSIEFEPAGEYILSRSCGVLSCLGRLLELYRVLGGAAPERWPSHAVDDVSKTVDRRLEADEGVEVADEYVFLAGGALLPIARESALSVRESTLLTATAHDVNNFAHGTAFQYTEPRDAVVVLLEARDDDTMVFDATESMLSELGVESIRVTSEAEQPWAAAELLAWSLAFSAQLNDAVSLDLANPPGLETVRGLLDQHTSAED